MQARFAQEQGAQCSAEFQTASPERLGGTASDACPNRRCPIQRNDPIPLGKGARFSAAESHEIVSLERHVPLTPSVPPRVPAGVEDFLGYLR
jgi:hypothetical protein